MNFDRLKKNLIAVIKESQIKLGYESMSFGVNYVTPSLLHMLDGATAEELPELLGEFCEQNKDEFGDITVMKTENGFRLDVPAKGVDYVNSTFDDNDFLVRFINEVLNPKATVDSIVAVFKSFSDNVVVKKINTDEFDYLIYFADGKPDEFWYCIDTEDLGMTYHRFMKDDYLDFNF